jgi:hypothetical protein
MENFIGTRLEGDHYTAGALAYNQFNIQITGTNDYSKSFPNKAHVNLKVEYKLSENIQA